MKLVPQVQIINRSKTNLAFIFHTTIDVAIIFISDIVGGGRNSRSDNDGMLIYVGEGINEIYNMPYFDNTMKTNFSVQVINTKIFVLILYPFNGSLV